MLKALHHLASLAAKEVPRQVSRGVQAYADAARKYQADKSGQINLLDLAERYNKILADPTKNADPTADVNRLIQVKDPKRGWISLWDAADPNRQKAHGPYRGISDNYSEDYHLSQEEVMGKTVRVPFNFCGKKVSYLEIEVKTPEDFARLKKTIEVPFENTEGDICVDSEPEPEPEAIVDSTWADAADQLVSNTASLGTALLIDSLVPGGVGSVSQLVDEMGVDYGCHDPDVIDGVVFVIGGDESEQDPCASTGPVSMTPMDTVQRSLLHSLQISQSRNSETEGSFGIPSKQSL